EHHHRWPACPKDRSRDAQVPELRQEVAERDQGKAYPAWPCPRYEVRQQPDRTEPRRHLRSLITHFNPPTFNLRLTTSFKSCVTRKRPSNSGEPLRIAMR